MILFNPVVLSVIVMTVLCLFKLNVLLALLFAALVAGLSANMDLVTIMNTIISGMGGQSVTALSYILLGAVAVAIGNSGVASILSKKLAKIVNGRKKMMLLLIAIFGCMSQNIIPVHIAYIPILIPPLILLMNEMKMDRRAMACALTYSLKMPYISIPAGFGLIFQGIIAKEMTKSGMEVAQADVWKSTWFLGLAMTVGLIIAIFFSYRKDREYENLPFKGIELVEDEKMETKHWLTLVAALAAFVVPILFDGSLPLGALAALILLIVFRVIKWKEIDKTIIGSVQLMGLIAFIMLVASGYANVINETGAVEELVNSIYGLIGGSKAIGVLLMLLVGLLITMGIGTSFGTIPVVASIYIPLCLKLGLSVSGSVIVLAAAAALGDAGSPASDSTLGPTSGLSVDGQHDHIWDTCVPTFLHYNILLIVGGFIGGLLL